MGLALEDTVNATTRLWLTVNPLIRAPYFTADRILYRGRVLSMVFDSEGTQYPHVGVTGFALLVDGKIVQQRPDLGPLTVELEPPRLETI